MPHAAKLAAQSTIVMAGFVGLVAYCARLLNDRVKRCVPKERGTRAVLLGFDEGLVAYESFDMLNM